MVKLRLKRMGRKHRPFYRIVAIPKRSKRDGKTLEEIGYHDPMNKDTKVDKERAEYWLSVGAQPSDTVRRILVREGIIEEEEKKVYKKEPGEKMKERKAKKAEKKKENKSNKEDK
jgi:small subunit ribosomal protein S16